MGAKPVKLLARTDYRVVNVENKVDALADVNFPKPRELKIPTRSFSFYMWKDVSV